LLDLLSLTGEHADRGQLAKLLQLRDESGEGEDHERREYYETDVVQDEAREWRAPDSSDAVHRTPSWISSR
jgi:hypothetical protein